MNRTNSVRIVTTTAQAAARFSYLSSFVMIMLCAWLLGVGSARAAGSEPWPEIAMPPKSKVEWVADSMRVNGMPMRVMHFESTAGRAAIVEYYRSYWSGGYRAKPAVRAVNDATVVSQVHGPYLMTVKVNDAPNQASEGLIAVSLVLGSKVDRSPGELPLMPGAHVKQVVESNDPGKRSRQVLISNPDSVPSVVQYYQTALTQAGWRQVQANDTPRDRGVPQGSFLVFLRDRSEVQLGVVAGPGGRGSVLAATVVTKDTVPMAF